MHHRKPSCCRAAAALVLTALSDSQPHRLTDSYLTMGPTGEESSDGFNVTESFCWKSALRSPCFLSGCLWDQLELISFDHGICFG